MSDYILSVKDGKERPYPSQSLILGNRFELIKELTLLQNFQQIYLRRQPRSKQDFSKLTKNLTKDNDTILIESLRQSKLSQRRSSISSQMIEQLPKHDYTTALKKKLKVTPIIAQVDSEGFYLHWSNDHSDVQSNEFNHLLSASSSNNVITASLDSIKCIDLVHVSDVRLALGLPLNQLRKFSINLNKVRRCSCESNTLSIHQLNDDDIAVNEESDYLITSTEIQAIQCIANLLPRIITVTYGTSFADVKHLHIIASEENVAKIWANEILNLAYCPYFKNLSLSETIRKFYILITIVTRITIKQQQNFSRVTSDCIDVRRMIKLMNSDLKYQKQILTALEHASLITPNTLSVGTSHHRLSFKHIKYRPTSSSNSSNSPIPPPPPQTTTSSSMGTTTTTTTMTNVVTNTNVSLITSSNSTSSISGNQMVNGMNNLKVFKENGNDRQLNNGNNPDLSRDYIQLSNFTYEKFRMFYQSLMKRIELIDICSEINQNAKKPLLTVEQMNEFLNTTQRDSRLNDLLYPKITLHKTMEMLEQSNPDSLYLSKGKISINCLYNYFQSSHANIIGNLETTFHHLYWKKNEIESYHHPLNDYFISTSHNTYLVGRQVMGKSKVEMYRQALLAGCRCVELDCWDRKMEQNRKNSDTFLNSTNSSIGESSKSIKQRRSSAIILPFIDKRIIDRKQTQPNSQHYYHHFIGKNYTGKFSELKKIPSMFSFNLLSRFPLKVDDKSTNLELKGNTNENQGIFPLMNGNMLTSFNASAVNLSSSATSINTMISPAKVDDDRTNTFINPTTLGNGDGKSAIEPFITHGYAMCTDLNLRETLYAIRESAFKTSPYPVILSFEDHCKLNSQNEIAEACKEIFDDHLLLLPMDEEDKILLPSPEDLKYKILVKHKKEGHNHSKKYSSSISDGSEEDTSDTDSVASSIYDMIESDQDETSTTFNTTASTITTSMATLEPKTSPTKMRVSTSNNEVSFQRRKSDKRSIKQKEENLSNLARLAIYTIAVPLKKCNFHFSENIPKPYEILSLSESHANVLMRRISNHFIKRNKYRLTRIYPENNRIDSSNYPPFDHWNAGSQMVALNWQTLDNHMQINLSKFENSKGYQLKPKIFRDRTKDVNFLESNNPEFHLDDVVAADMTIRIISGQFLTDRKCSVYVLLELYGLSCDTYHFLKKYKTTESSRTYSLNAYFNETFTFKQIRLPEHVLLKLSVFDTSQHLLGQRTIPLQSILSGYRYVMLRNNCNQPLTYPANLFIYINLVDQVVNNHRDIMSALINPRQSNTMTNR
ncbi:hypothetical protein SNEBB_001200 [Seison nebaliae]|nr:hypothetical protein SNEBB_001200 [Seison nebaliae]